MNIKTKLVMFFVAGIFASVLFYIKFAQNINNNGLLSFIGTETIIVVVICHGIAFLIRSSLVRRNCRSLGIYQGDQTWVPDVSIADKPLFSKTQKSYNKVAALFFLLAVVLTGIALSLFFRIKDFLNEAFEPYLMQYWTSLASIVLAMIMLFFTIHFLLMSFLLEYKSKVKAIFVSLLSFIVVFLLSTANF